MASQGPNAPGGAFDDPSTGSNDWGATEGNIAADDAATADCTIDTAGTSDYLEGYSYNLSIPADAQVLGIVVEVKSADLDGLITDDVVRLRNASSAPSPTGSNRGNAAAIPTSLGYTTYGSSSDLWGLSWTPSDINNGNFGVVLQFGNADAASHTVSVDHIRVTVYYRVLTFTTQPSDTEVGLTISPAVVVDASDSSFTGNVTVAIGTNPGGGSLSGTLTQAAVAGVATFNNLSINSPGTGYTLTAASTGLTTVTSNTFNITGTTDVLHPQACL